MKIVILLVITVAVIAFVAAGVAIVNAGAVQKAESEEH